MNGGSCLDPVCRKAKESWEVGQSWLPALRHCTVGYLMKSLPGDVVGQTVLDPLGLTGFWSKNLG